VIYNHVILVLKGVSLSVPKGGITALLGGNGAGKTTTLKAISNLLKSERGEVTKGSIPIAASGCRTCSPSDLVKRGVIQVMEGRHCFEHLTVEENLLTGAYTRADGQGAIDADLDLVYELFPPAEGAPEKPGGLYLGRRAADVRHRPRADVEARDHPAGRAVMGLAPQLVEADLRHREELNENEGVSFLLAEQNTNVALRFAHHGYILESGRVVMDGPAAELRENPDVKEFYLGMSEEGRKSFRDVRSYRRRKRWLS
jgi:branched-chain amino acid transport system ATP-binding protein